jgi:hypothetical protein
LFCVAKGIGFAEGEALIPGPNNPLIEKGAGNGKKNGILV